MIPPRRSGSCRCRIVDNFSSTSRQAQTLVDKQNSRCANFRLRDLESRPRERKRKELSKFLARCFALVGNLAPYVSRISDWVALRWRMTRARERMSFRIRRLKLLTNEENISSVVRITRTCKDRLLAHYEIVLHRLKIKRSVICEDRVSCVYHEEETCLRVHRSTSNWWVHRDAIRSVCEIYNR